MSLFSSQLFSNTILDIIKKHIQYYLRLKINSKWCYFKISLCSPLRTKSSKWYNEASHHIIIIIIALLIIQALAFRLQSYSLLKLYWCVPPKVGEGRCLDACNHQWSSKCPECDAENWPAICQVTFGWIWIHCMKREAWKSRQKSKKRIWFRNSR